MNTNLQYLDDSIYRSTSTLSRLPLSRIGPTLLAIIQSAGHGVVVVDAAHRIVLMNHKAEHLFGCAAEEVLDKPLDVLIPQRSGSEQKRRLEKLTGARANGRRSKLELKGIHASGKRIPLNASISRIIVHGEVLIALVFHDTSLPVPNGGIKMRPENAFHLAISSQQANEVEKRRFSRKLYDDIGQRLSVLKLELDWLESDVENRESQLPVRVARMQGLLDQVISSTKNMASTLRPPLLDDFGLLPAVEWMVERFQKKTAIKCSLKTQGMTAKLDDAVESAIFRVIQEGLSNIERHARARSVMIVFALLDGRLDVMIRDDGIGIGRGSENKPGCYGLLAMQERILVLEGTISIQNVRPHGVAIHASIPIETVFPSEPITHWPPP
jgi:PAS domain S-box-containing protein